MSVKLRFRREESERLLKRFEEGKEKGAEAEEEEEEKLTSRTRAVDSS